MTAEWGWGMGVALRYWNQRRVQFRAMPNWRTGHWGEPREPGAEPLPQRDSGAQPQVFRLYYSPDGTQVPGPDLPGGSREKRTRSSPLPWRRGGRKRSLSVASPPGRPGRSATPATRVRRPQRRQPPAPRELARSGPTRPRPRAPPAPAPPPPAGNPPSPPGPPHPHTHQPLSLRGSAKPLPAPSLPLPPARVPGAQAPPTRPGPSRRPARRARPSPGLGTRYSLRRPRPRPPEASPRPRPRPPEVSWAPGGRRDRALRAAARPPRMEVAEPARRGE